MISRISNRRGAVQRKPFLQSFFSSRLGRILFATVCTIIFSIAILLEGADPVGFLDSIETSDIPATSVLRTKEPKHHCLNDDFRPQNKIGVWTMLNDNMSYVKGAAKLGLGIRKKTKTPVDLVVMELKSKPLGKDVWKILEPAGFLRCSVESIEAPAKTRHDLKEKFAVLHVWGMEVYERVLFLDADTYPQNSIDDLLHMDLQGKAIGVTKDIRDKKWVDTFNSGVLLLHPDEEEYKRLIELLYSGIKYDFIMSDQGFLNEVYKDNWHEIGFVNNANTALYRFKRKFWDEHKPEDINIIHYTMKKPWKCKQNDQYKAPCDVWLNA